MGFHNFLKAFFIFIRAFKCNAFKSFSGQIHYFFCIGRFFSCIMAFFMIFE